MLAMIFASLPRPAGFQRHAAPSMDAASWRARADLAAATPLFCARADDAATYFRAYIIACFTHDELRRFIDWRA